MVDKNNNHVEVNDYIIFFDLNPIPGKIKKIGEWWCDNIWIVVFEDYSYRKAGSIFPVKGSQIVKLTEEEMVAYRLAE